MQQYKYCCITISTVSNRITSVLTTRSAENETNWFPKLGLGINQLRDKKGNFFSVLYKVHSLFHMTKTCPIHMQDVRGLLQDVCVLKQDLCVLLQDVCVIALQDVC